MVTDIDVVAVAARGTVDEGMSVLDNSTGADFETGKVDLTLLVALEETARCRPSFDLTLAVSEEAGIGHSPSSSGSTLTSLSGSLFAASSSLPPAESRYDDVFGREAVAGSAANRSSNLRRRA